MPKHPPIFTAPLGEGRYSLVTVPFEEDGGLDLFAFERLLEEQISAGWSIAFGFPEGEGLCLSRREYRLLLEDCVQMAQGRVKVLAGCFSGSTAEALELGEIGAEAGADLLFLPPPFGVGRASGGYFAHLKAVSAVGVPFLCSLPQQSKARTAGAFVDPLLLCEETARLPCFAGFLTGELDSAEGGACLACRPDLSLYLKNDALLYPALGMGFSGVLSFCACLLPRQTALLVLEGGKRSQKGAALQRALLPLCPYLCGEGGGAFLKWGLHKDGRLSPHLRLPQVLPEQRRLCAFERTLLQVRRAALLGTRTE